MPSHQERVQRTKLHPRYQYGDAKAIAERRELSMLKRLQRMALNLMFGGRPSQRKIFTDINGSAS